jgi:transcription termination factor Rho
MEKTIVFEHLEELTVKELREIAKNLKVKNYWNMRKADLVEQIKVKQSEKEKEETNSKDKVDVKEIKVPVKVEEAKRPVVQEPIKVEESPSLKRLEIGAIIAFKIKVRDDIKLRSAKVIRTSHRNRSILIEDKMMKRYVISFDDVAWVKTGKRWPGQIFKALKGGTYNEKR